MIHVSCGEANMIFVRSGMTTNMIGIFHDEGTGKTSYVDDLGVVDCMMLSGRSGIENRSVIESASRTSS